MSRDQTGVRIDTLEPKIEKSNYRPKRVNFLNHDCSNHNCSNQDCSTVFFMIAIAHQNNCMIQLDKSDFLAVALKGQK
jgi:hypothetical protein